MKLNNISKAFFINLERRKDRLDHINKNLPFYAERFDAIDANNIELNEEIEKLFKKSLNKLTKAEIACCLSHYKLWKQLTIDKEADNYLILEDDVVFKKGFTNFWNQVFSKNIPKNYNLLYLGGCQPWNKPQYHKVLKPYNQYFYNVKKNNFFNKEDHYFHMNAQSYVISKQGANLICQYIDQLGFDSEKSQADIFMINFFNKNKIFELPNSIFHLYPNMSYQLHEENDNIEIDQKSDIRHASEKIHYLEKISVIIPTIWKANNYLRQSLQDLDKEYLVEEIIVINNNKEETPNWIKQNKKVKLIDPGERLYFNKSVNLGVDLCKNDICCALNDDVIIINRNIFKYISEQLKHESGAIFISKNSINAHGVNLSIELKKISGIEHGNGMLFFLRKSSFVKIPEKIVHHHGDGFIAAINKLQKKQNYTIQGFKIRTKESASQKYAKEVISKDWRIYKEVFDNLNQFLPQESSDDRRISVVIPTIWMANDYMMSSLLDLDKVDCIEEVIVINNDKTKTPHWINASKKVKVVDPGKRMYFNESVNLGIDLCKNDICCIYNDDITSDTRVFNYVKNNFSEKDGCIFISPKYINQQTRSTGNLKKVNDIIKDGLHRGSGMMMFVRKNSFIKIPENLIHHFGDTFIFKINQKQGRQNYIIEGFPIQTPGSASEDDAVRKVISRDWAVHKEIFDDLDQFITGKQVSFPSLRGISNKKIPKKIHLSWKNKNVLNSNHSLIKKGAKNLQLLNPDWDIEVHDDEDINKLLRDTIGRSDWDLIKDRKITEKTDLWRLIKTYQEGGLYIDIDRYIDTPLSEVINSKTSLVLPTYLDADFSQDFILSCAKSPILGKAISNNLHYRRQGESLFFLAVQSYLLAVSEFVINKKLTRGQNKKEFDI